MGMRTEHLKLWLTKALKAAKDSGTAARKEEAAERARPGISEAQKGTESESDNWTSPVGVPGGEACGGSNVVGGGYDS